MITAFSGPSNKEGAAWADVRYFGVTADANTEVAQQFFGIFYERWVCSYFVNSS